MFGRHHRAMRAACIVPWVALAAHVIAQAGNSLPDFEPHGFNVTSALEDLGVNVSTIPDPQSSSPILNGRSLAAKCSLAVGHNSWHSKAIIKRNIDYFVCELTIITVYFVKHPFRFQSAAGGGNTCIRIFYRSILVWSAGCIEPILRFQTCKDSACLYVGADIKTVPMPLCCEGRWTCSVGWRI